MSDRFTDAVDLPNVPFLVPAPGEGYVRIYGRGLDAYAKFSDGTEKKLTAEGTTIIADGDRDVSYEESLDISDKLSANIGPVRTDDSVDFKDSFVGDDLFFGDSADVADRLVLDDGLTLDDSLDVADQLSANIGPVAIDDTTDLSDEFVGRQATLDDSVDMSDFLVVDQGLALADSADVSDHLNEGRNDLTVQDSTDLNDEFVGRQATLDDSAEMNDAAVFDQGATIAEELDIADKLSATIGPVYTQDSVDFGDTPDFGPLTLVESADISDQVDASITADHDESLAITDRLSNIIRIDYEKFFVGETLTDEQRLTLLESLAASDQFNRVEDLVLLESADFQDRLEADLDFRHDDSQAFADSAVFGPLTTYDTLAVADFRRVATLTNAVLWPNTVVSQTGMTNPNNLIDTSTTTGASISITQSGGFLGGSSQNASGNITVSCANVVFNPELAYTAAQIQWGWATTASGGLQSGNSVNAVLEYSLNDGGSWINLQTVTTVATTGNPTLNVTVNTSQLNQLRFRVTVTVTSGTTAVVGGASQSFQINYFRIQFSGTQTL